MTTQIRKEGRKACMKLIKNAFMFRVASRVVYVCSMTPETSIRMRRKRKLKKKKKNMMGTEMGINFFSFLG